MMEEEESSMWADVESEVDYLNFTELAVLVAELLKEDELLPISIGVFGGWGTGKSSLIGLHFRPI